MQPSADPFLQTCTCTMYSTYGLKHGAGASGDMVFVRYAGDLVFGFEKREDAERLLREFRRRLASFALQLHREKTRLIEFGRFAQGESAAPW